MKINLTPNFTAMITAHGKTRSYLHRFKIIESPQCSCANGNQTVDRLLFQCSKLSNEREKLIAYISKRRQLAGEEKELVNKYLKQLTNFTISIGYGKMETKNQCINIKQIRKNLNTLYIIKYVVLLTYLLHGAESFLRS